LTVSSDDLPALLGGPPAYPPGPPPWPPADPAVLAALQAAHADGSWGRYYGDHVERLEERLAALNDVPYAIACASGTLAVEAALRALSVGPGDEVILAAYDYESNFLTVHALGARPVLVDVAPGNWNLDPDRLAAAAGPQTKAVVASHLHGGLMSMREVMAVAAAHGLGVVEDAAQAAGATVQGRPAGAWGDAGVLSFGGSKLLSAGRGGAVLTPRADLHQRARLWLRRGVQPWAALSELQSIVLGPQLDRLAERHARRAAAVRQIAADLAAVPGLEPFVNTVDGSPAYYKVGFRYDAAAFGLPRERFTAAVRAEGVALDEGFRAAHVGRAPHRFRRGGDLAEAERAGAGCVVLHHPVLLGEPEDLAAVGRAVGKVYRHRGALAP
jgi:dTDP-4-amino-4,6-dideoxygalactose transaminase